MTALAMGLLLQTAAGTYSPLRLMTQVQRVWDPGTGAPTAVIAYALAVDGLVRPHQAEVTLWRIVRADGHDRVLKEMHQEVITSRETHRSGYFVAQLEATSGWAIEAAAIVGPRHRTLRRTLDIPPLEGASLALSDLVLGVESQGVSFPSGLDSVRLAPLGVMNRNEPIELYYQLRSDGAYAELRTTIRILRIVGTEAEEEEVLQIASRDRVNAGLNEIRRVLGVSSLPGGQYQLDLTVTTPSGSTVRRRSLMMHLVS